VTGLHADLKYGDAVEQFSGWWVVVISGIRRELSPQLGRASRPSEIAQRLGLSPTEVIEAMHAGQAYHSSSLEEIVGSQAAVQRRGASSSADWTRS
jgi:DNA-directed RNA polymerase specialized sigma subunit